jgi:hypothetical protein
VNRIAFFSLAAFRTPANPWDTRVSLCVECVLDPRMFSLIFHHGQRPSLLPLRKQLSVFVRMIHRYYATVRLLEDVSAGLAAIAFSRSPAALPRALGAIGILGGASFVVKNFLIVLAPQFDLPYVIAPMMLAMLSTGLWLLAKGVDRAQWDMIQAAQVVSER